MHVMSIILQTKHIRLTPMLRTVHESCHFVERIIAEQICTERILEEIIICKEKTVKNMNVCKLINFTFTKRITYF